MRKKYFNWKFYFVIGIIQFKWCEGVFNIEAIETDTARVKAVEGYNASLPCAVVSPPRDSPVLTLWYIGTEETPVYSYDQRSYTSPSSWADNSVMGSRAIFLPSEHPPVLLLVNVSRSDAKTYRCRVDYNFSNSRVAWVQLAVVVPPSDIVLDPKSIPVEEGHTKDIACKIISGSPLARVVWLQGGEVVDESYSFEDNSSVNTLDVAADREDLNKPFTCSGNNNDLTPPLIATYFRNVTCGPTSVKITTEQDSLVEGRLIRFFCTVIGSNPPPRISWFLENNQITRYIKTISWANKTMSRLDFHISKKSHKNLLVCRAENSLLPHATLEDNLILNIAYKPNVSLSLGRSLNPNQLKESNDLFFDCSIDSNPPPYKVGWYHEGKLLSHNVSDGVLVSDHTLALQRVDRERSGRYQCSASNVEGDTMSNNVTINILYAPRCAVPPSLRGVALGEITNVSCVVDADPKNVSYKWEFNNSARKDTSEIVSRRRYSEEGLRSTLSYTPLTERDYGTLFCTAVNSVGAQKEPCSYTVISAGPPEQVSNCSLGKLTSHSAEISCLQGFDGGLPQQFLLQVYEARTGLLVINVTGVLTRFIAKPLESGTAFHASVIAFNSRGRSMPSSLKFRTLREAAMHKILPSKKEPSPLLWVGGVVCGVFLVLASLLIAVWLLKKKQSFHSNGRSLTTVIMKDHNPDLINMEGHEEKFSDIEQNNGDSTEGLVNPTKDTDYKRANYHDARTLRQNSIKSYSPRFKANDPALFASCSPDVNDKTRLTSPREFRRPRASPSDTRESRTTIVRTNRDPLGGPESTF